MLRNFWYVAAQAHELAGGALSRMILSVPLVLFRSDSGQINALLNVCSHRGAPLSMGRIADGRISCPYHGVTFDGTGTCVYIPGQQKIPVTAHVRSFPVEERHGILWVWMGRAEDADVSKIPQTPWRSSPEWNADTVYYYHVNASHMLMTDNLLDLGHVAFIHADTIGFDASRLENDPLVTDVEENLVRNTRVIPDVDPGPSVRGWAEFRGRAERTSISEWIPPCFTFIDFINRDDRNDVALKIDHLITPETENTHHYWVMISRNFRIDDHALTQKLYKDNDRVHQQDLEIVEATQRSLASWPDFREMAIRQDRGLIAAHRILDRHLAAEAATAGSAVNVA